MLTLNLAPYGVIYHVVCKVNGKGYVGQTTIGVEARWVAHCSAGVRKGAVGLGHAIRKHGREEFTIEVVDLAWGRPELDAKEQHWIVLLGTRAPLGYNLDEGGQGCGPRPEEVKAKIRATLTGRKRPEVGATLVEVWKTKPRVPVSADTRQAMVESHLGLRHTDETRKAMREAQKKRRQDEALKGVKPRFSDASREALRVANTGRLHSEESKEKNRIHSTGRIHTEETKAKIRAKRIARDGPTPIRQISNPPTKLNRS